MPARSDLTVTLSDSDECHELVIDFDQNASANAQVDVRLDSNYEFSVSLNDLEEFAALLVEFVQHHHRVDKVEDGEQP